MNENKGVGHSQKSYFELTMARKKKSKPSKSSKLSKSSLVKVTNTDPDKVTLLEKVAGGIGLLLFVIVAK